MTRPQRRRCLVLVAALLGMGPAWAWSAAPPLVLVASGQSPITRLTASEVRKLYLGLPLLVEGQTVKPLRNASDPLLTEMFMQRVMFMSSEAYERQILTRVFRAGGSRPPIYRQHQELLLALSRNPMAVTYMLRDQAAAIPALRIVGEP